MSDLIPELVLPLLRGRLGTPYRFVAECASTQRLIGEDDPEGTTVATDHQTQGRGRLGRTWEDVPGRSILMSVLLLPRPPMPLWPELSLVAGEAVARALRNETGVDASLRHPNDVVVAGRKLVGVLPEARKGRVVLGIGVNVNQPSDELPADTVEAADVAAGRARPRSRAGTAPRRDSRRARAWLRRVGRPLPRPVAHDGRVAGRVRGDQPVGASVSARARTTPSSVASASGCSGARRRRASAPPAPRRGSASGGTRAP